MRKKLAFILKDRRGFSFPFVVAAALALVMVLCGVTEYLRLCIIAAGVRDAVQSAVIATVTDNYGNVYHGCGRGTPEDTSQAVPHGTPASAPATFTGGWISFSGCRMKTAPM